MNQLIIYAHPNPVSFCHGLMIAMRDTYLSLGNDVLVNDLYAIKFDPVLSEHDFEKMNGGKYLRNVEVEHEKIDWVDVITFICPVWWQGMPAILKGYIDRVFSSGYAYTITDNGVEGMLQNKRFLMICTTGLSESYYKKTGMRTAMAKTIGEGIFDFAVFRWLFINYFMM